MERHVFPCIYKSFWNNAPKISDTLAFRHRLILLKASCEMFCKCSCKCSRFNYIGFQFSFISVDCLWIVLSVKAKERPSCSTWSMGCEFPNVGLFLWPFALLRYQVVFECYHYVSFSFWLLKRMYYFLKKMISFSTEMSMGESFEEPASYRVDSVITVSKENRWHSLQRQKPQARKPVGVQMKKLLNQ